jgi:hypothetical protein
MRKKFSNAAIASRYRCSRKWHTAKPSIAYGAPAMGGEDAPELPERHTIAAQHHVAPSDARPLQRR